MKEELYSAKSKKLDVRVPSCVQYAIGKVHAFGYEKYNTGTIKQWIETIGAEEAKDIALRALERHKIRIGGVDKESGLPHLWHALYCMHMVIEADRVINPELYNMEEL